MIYAAAPEARLPKPSRPAVALGGGEDCPRCVVNPRRTGQKYCVYSVLCTAEFTPKDHIAGIGLCTHSPLSVFRTLRVSVP